jgi:hypothetical protein
MENLKDMNIKCVDCEETFVFPVKYNYVSERSNEYVKKILSEIEDFKQKGLIEQANQRQKDLDDIDNYLIENKQGDSQEAYAKYGFTNFPNRCPNCRAKKQEEVSSRSGSRR